MRSTTSSGLAILEAFDDGEDAMAMIQFDGVQFETEGRMFVSAVFVSGA